MPRGLLMPCCRSHGSLVDLKCPQVQADPDNSVVKLGLMARVKMKDTVRQGRRSVLAMGIAVLLCLTSAGCDGFFISPSISSIYITPSAATVSVNNTQQLTATATYSDGSKNTITGNNVGWSSSNDAVATITNGGLVTGVAVGSATMTASSEGVTGTATVTVTVQNLTTIAITTTQGSTNNQCPCTIPGSPNVTLQFYAYANMSSSQDITNAVTWTTSNPSVATISNGLSSGNGLVTSQNTGTTVITASSTTSTGTVTSNAITVTVQ